MKIIIMLGLILLAGCCSQPDPVSTKPKYKAGQKVETSPFYSELCENGTIVDYQIFDGKVIYHIFLDTKPGKQFYCPVQIIRESDIKVKN